MDHVEELARLTGKSVSDFMRDGITAHMKSIDEERRVAERHAKEMKERSSFPSKPIGMPEWAKLTPREEEEPANAPAPSTPSVVIHNGSPPDGTSHLATWVESAPHAIERGERERIAMKILKESTPEADQERILTAFKERIGVKTSPGKRILNWLTK